MKLKILLLFFIPMLCFNCHRDNKEKRERKIEESNSELFKESDYMHFIDRERNLALSISTNILMLEDDIDNTPYWHIYVSCANNDIIISQYWLNIDFREDVNYLINDDFYEDTGILVIKGLTTCYLYSVNQDVMSEQIKPDYASKNCSISDSQDIYIKSISILEKELTISLNNEECGVFSYDIKNLDSIIVI